MTDLAAGSGCFGQSHNPSSAWCKACRPAISEFRFWPRNWNTRRDKQRVCRQRGHEASNPGDCPAASHPPRPSAFSKLAPKFRILLGESPGVRQDLA